MEQLESEYPDVIFIYMTDTCDSSGSTGYNRFLRNEQIRKYCRENNKVLFDFADLESWSADGSHQNTYSYGGISNIPLIHSDWESGIYYDDGHINEAACTMKAKAMWWLLARIAGWDGSPGTTDGDADGIADITDNCPGMYNSSQFDADGDGLGDVCDDCLDLDNDGVCGDVDNCIGTPNPGQDDADNDGIGNACDNYLDVDADGTSDGVDTTDKDDDSDGVTNENDECLYTPSGEVVYPSNGCSIDQLVPCEGPKDKTESWRNPRKYMSALKKELRKFVRKGLITTSEKDDIIREKSVSSCGR